MDYHGLNCGSPFDKGCLSHLPKDEDGGWGGPPKDEVGGGAIPGGPKKEKLIKLILCP